jgi:hypothetical protein
MNRFVLALAALAGGLSSLAAGQDMSALDLADSTPALPVAAPRPWKLNLQGGAHVSEGWDGASAVRYQAALDGRIDYRLMPQLRAVASGRVERMAQPSAAPHDGAEHGADHSLYYTRSALKEAYLSWQPTASQVLDAGRINPRFGVATGYNPTDFFKAGALVGTSPDPESRRNNRLGSVMLQGQQLWDSGSVSLLLSPRLAALRDPGMPEAGDALAKTNGINRALLTGSAQLGKTLRPQWLLYREQGHETQYGLSLSTLLGQAAVVYGEWAGGRAPSLPALAAGRGDDLRFRSRSAFGVTYTLPSDVTATLEWQSNGAGVTRSDALALAAADPRAWGNTLAWSGALQEPFTRHALFLHVSARNVLVQGFDLAGFVQADRGNNGRQSWLELRKRLGGASLSLQWQQQRGDAWTRFGALPERSSVKLLADIYY